MTNLITKLLISYALLQWAVVVSADEEEAITTTIFPMTDTTTEATVDEDYVQEDENVKQLVNIYSLTEHCIKDHCRGFRFERSEEIAFFDLQTEVRIAPDGETYDFGSGMSTNSDTLVFENSTFVNFPLHLFYALELSELDIRNCSVEHVSWEAFLMANKLVLLLLSDNKIKQVDEMTFNYASELQYLFMSSNRLRKLVPKSFNGLRKLRHLDLSENFLHELPDGIFHDLPALQEINLSGNRLRIIDNALFIHNPVLLTVTLKSNRLRELGENAFREQTKLVALDVSNNQKLQKIVLNFASARFLLAANCSLYRVNVYGSVMNVDLRDNHIMELYFSEPEVLETLVLRNNALLQIASLSRATKLHYLDLADNPDLGELPDPWQAEALTRLDLSNTSLKVLPIASIITLPKLRNLNVSNNDLREINPMNFRYLDNLTHFYIHANNWNCFNLNILMDLLIKPKGISYTIDRFDLEFPGEYINGIACMYRLEQDDNDDVSSGNDDTHSNENDLSYASSSLTAAAAEPLKDFNKQKLSMDPALGEIQAMRRELKAIVGFYDQKLDRVFQMLNDLSAKMRAIEQMNSTMWQQVTIKV